MTPRRLHRHGEQSGHVPIIDVNPRRDKALKELKEMEPKARANVNIPDPKAIRYSNRSTVERVNARLKDEFGGRHVRVGATRRSSRTSCSAFWPWRSTSCSATCCNLRIFHRFFGRPDTGRR